VPTYLILLPLLAVGLFRVAKAYKRRAHFLPGNKSSETPQHCIWVDTETLPTKVDDDTEAHYLDFGMACYRRRTDNGAWSAPDWFTFKTREEFWEWTISKTRNKTRLYIFAHNGAFDLPVLAAFTQLPERGYTISKAICDAPPIDITWRNDKRTIRFVDTLNIWRMSLAQIGESVGLRKLRMPEQHEHPARHLAYCRRDVKVIMQACIKWFAFLVDNDLGGFRSTLASQAFSSYRHRFMQHQIGIHNNAEALTLERMSYVGGRTECFRLGKYEGEFYYIDVNSMYPSVMKGNLYPSKLVRWSSNVVVADLARWRDEFAVIGEVTLDTDQADYPIIHNGRLVFPVGRFRTALAGPELYQAYDAGHVVELHQAAIYRSEELFTDYVDYVYGQRVDARSRGDVVNAYNFKILANSLYGKFGQRGRRFEKVGDCDPNTIAIEESYDADSGEFSTVRYFGGIVQEWISEDEAFNSFPAIAAFVTSYARRVLSTAINLADRSNCYYCDTDSLVVNRQGWERICHLVDQDLLGAWSLDRILEAITLHGPKDYVFDGDMKVKGVRKDATWVDDSTVEQDLFVGFRGLVRRASLDAPLVTRIRKKQRRVYLKGSPSANGVVLPLEIGDRGGEV